MLTITPLTGTATTIGSETEPLRVRMPIYSGVWNDYLDGKITEKGEVADKTANNTYLYENLRTNNVGPYGYWTLSSYAGNYKSAWSVTCGGYVYDFSGVDFDDNYGARPVINLKI